MKIYSLDELKIEEAYYGEETGISVVVISTPLGKFAGYAFLHPDDRARDRGNKIVGCEYAHRRAYGKYLKKANLILKNEIKMLKILQKELKETTPEELLRQKKGQLDNNKTILAYNEKWIQDKDKAREKFFEKLEKNKQEIE